MQLVPTSIPGCIEIHCENSVDNRGRFVKTFRDDFFREHDIQANWIEDYYTVSARNVVRGMHFQIPPSQHAKIVHCMSGTVLDVVLDLRKTSPTYRKVWSCKLSAQRATSIYLPAGLAHGFLSLSDHAIMHYRVTSAYSKADDRGILWNSIGFDWPTSGPIVSERDQGHPPLCLFESPF